MKYVLAFFIALMLAAPAMADDDPMAFAREGMGVNHPGIPDSSARAKNAQTGAPMQLAGGDLLDAARRYLGARRSPTGFRGAWCGDFLGLVARHTGADVPRNYRLARSWAGAGSRSAPRVGAVAVMRHHVTIIAQIVPGGFIGIGGNQGRRVKYSHYSWRGVIAIRSV